MPIQYADSRALAAVCWLQGAVLEQQLAYWRVQLAEGRAAGVCLTDHPRPPVQTHRGAFYRYHLLFPLYWRDDSLPPISQREQVTLFMFLLAAFHVLLARFSGQTDIAVGTALLPIAPIMS